jgi:hypothetical protein
MRIVLHNGLVLSFVAAAAAACGTTNNTTVETTPNANGVFPANGFIGTAERLEITGDATDWTATTTVAFSGTGITVGTVTVASVDDIFVDVTIDGTATAGLQDVTITDTGGSDGTLTLGSAFEVDSPVALTFQGDLAQGGFPFYTINNLNLLVPFDTTTDPTTGLFTNEVITSPTGVDFVVDAVSITQITGRVEIDLDATGGDVTLTSGAGSAAITLDLGTQTISPVTPTALTEGSDNTVTIGGVGDTTVLSVTMPNAQVLEFGSDTAVTDANAQPFLEVMPDGTWADGVGLPFLGSAQTLDMVAGDNATEANYTLVLEIVPTNLKLLEAELDDTTNNGSATTTQVYNDTDLPGAMSPATLSSATDIDVIKLTNVPKGATIFVDTTLGGDALTDTAVDIENDAGVSLTGGIVDGGVAGGDGGETCEDVAFFGGSCGEQVTSTATAAAGTFFVFISAGAAFDDTDDAYAALIELN